MNNKLNTSILISHVKNDWIDNKLVLNLICIKAYRSEPKGTRNK
jgi:hypothetical protein